MKHFEAYLNLNFSFKTHADNGLKHFKTHSFGWTEWGMFHTWKLFFQQQYFCPQTLVCSPLKICLPHHSMLSSCSACRRPWRFGSGVPSRRNL